MSKLTTDNKFWAVVKCSGVYGSIQSIEGLYDSKILAEVAKQEFATGGHRDGYAIYSGAPYYVIQEAERKYIDPSSHVVQKKRREMCEKLMADRKRLEDEKVSLQKRNQDEILKVEEELRELGYRIPNDYLHNA